MQKMKKAGYILLALLLALLLGLSAYAEQTAAEESAPPLEIEQPGQSGSGMELSQTVEPAGAPAASTAMKPSASPEPTALPEPTVKPTPTRQSEPSVRFARNFSAQHAEKGDEITLSYTVRNEGTLSVRNIVVEDGLVGKVGTIERLDPGERRTISARVTVNQTCKSTPVMSYEYGGKTYSKRLAAQEIQLANVKMSVTLEADKKNVAPGEMVTLRLRVVNEGDVNLYGLRAVESMLGEMGSIVSVLPPGDECVVTRTVPMKSGATFRFCVTGSSDTGADFEVYSNEMDVVVTQVAAQVRMTLRTQADLTELSAPGEVCFALYLDNECTLELRDVLLSETTRGEIRKLAFVPSGEMPPIFQSYRVEESGWYHFMAQVTDSVGDETTVYSEPVFIAVHGGNGQEPQTTAVREADTKEPAIPLLEGDSYRMADDTATFEKLMTGTVLLMLAVLLVWYTAARIREEKKRRRRRRRKKKRAKAKKMREK